MGIFDSVAAAPYNDATSGLIDVVFSPGELARAAGVPARRVLDLIAAGNLATVDGVFVGRAEAVRVGRLLTSATIDAALEPPIAAPQLFCPPAYAQRSAGLPILASTSFHAVIVAMVLVLSTVGLTSSEEPPVENETEPIRLVYLNLPEPGGGGGGGGLRQPAPPPRAEREGARRVSSPLPARTPPKPVVPVPEPVDPEPEVLEHEPLPPIAAPLLTAPADLRDRRGVIEKTEAVEVSRGPGTDGGVGSGAGTGLGSGQGPGVGPGSGGGTGGGPYRPGSGIEPPRLLHEVRPDYTEAARQRNLEGNVLLEIVIRRDGRVGDVRILRSLDIGLDERAVQAVRQWRFTPARRLGAPVEVVVEVSVEFKLR